MRHGLPAGQEGPGLRIGPRLPALWTESNNPTAPGRCVRHPTSRTCAHMQACTCTPWHAHTCPQIPPLPLHTGMLKLASTFPGALSPLVLTPHPRTPLSALAHPPACPTPPQGQGACLDSQGPAVSYTSPLGSAPGPASLSQQPPIPLPSVHGPWMGAPAVPTSPPTLDPVSLNPVLPFSCHPHPSLDLSLEPVEFPFPCLLANQNQVGCPTLVHMSMCVSVCAHVSVCALVCVCMCTSVLVCQCVHACIHACMCVHTCLCACASVFVVCGQVSLCACASVCVCACVHVSVCARAPVCVCVSVYMYVSVHACVYVCVSVCTCVYVCLCIGVHACRCVHACIHACMCVHTCPCVRVHSYPHVNAACLHCVHTYGCTCAGHFLGGTPCSFSPAAQPGNQSPASACD